MNGMVLIAVVDSNDETTEIITSSQTCTSSSQTSTGTSIQRTQSFEVMEISPFS